MHHKRFIYGCYLLLSTMLMACHDAQQPTPSHYRLKSVLYIYNAGNVTLADTMVETYSYDQAGRLASRNSVNSALTTNTVFYYDTQNRLGKRESYLQHTYDNIALTHRKTTTYAYDSSARVTVVKTYSSNKVNAVFLTDYFTLDDESTMEYNGISTLPAKITTKVNTGWQYDPTVYYTEEFTYTNGNITSLKHTDLPTKFNKYQTSTRLDNWQYDSHPNPYYGLDLIDVDGVIDDAYYSKNNPLLSDVTYTYDQRGLVVTSNEGNGLIISQYTYEAY